MLSDGLPYHGRFPTTQCRCLGFPQSKKILITNKLVNSHYGPMIINANDKWIGPSIEQFGAWAADDIELIKNILEIQLLDKSHVTFYDVGANIGTHTVALGRHFNSKISIRSFEAQRHMYYLLCGNVALNGLDNTTCHQVAIGDGSMSSIDVVMPDYKKINNFGGLELVEAINSDNSLMCMDKIETVACATLDSFSEPVDFIKLDIEGMECQALDGAKNIINNYKPVCFVEVLKSDIVKIQNYFRSMNYNCYKYKPDDWIFVPKDSDVELDLPIVLL